MTGNRRAVAGLMLAAVAVFWATELALLLAYVVVIRAGHGSVSSSSATAAGAVIAFAASAVAARCVSPRLRRAGVPAESALRLATAGPLAATLVAEVGARFGGGPVRFVLVLAGAGLGGVLGVLLDERAAGRAATEPVGSGPRGGRQGSVTRRRSTRPR